MKAPSDLGYKNLKYELPVDSRFYEAFTRDEYTATSKKYGDNIIIHLYLSHGRKVKGEFNLLSVVSSDLFFHSDDDKGKKLLDTCCEAYEIMMNDVKEVQEWLDFRKRSLIYEK